VTIDVRLKLDLLDGCFPHISNPDQAMEEEREGKREGERGSLRLSPSFALPIPIS